MTRSLARGVCAMAFLLLREKRPEDGDAGPAAHLAVELDLAGMVADDLRADGESKAGALAALFRREEWVEHLGAEVFRDAAAGVADFHAQVAPARAVRRGIGPRRNFDLRACGRRVERVHDEVDEH